MLTRLLANVTFILALILTVAPQGEGAAKAKKTKKKAAQAKSDQIVQRKIAVPNHGTLLLNLPASWQQSQGPVMDGLPATTFFKPDKGEEFEVQILPLWSPNNDPSFNSPPVLKQLVEMDAGVFQATEAEKAARISTFKGRNGTGYYYFDTVFAKSPGGPDQAMKGSFAVGDLMVNITLICRGKDAPIVATFIKILEEADKTR